MTCYHGADDVSLHGFTLSISNNSYQRFRHQSCPKCSRAFPGVKNAGQKVARKLGSPQLEGSIRKKIGNKCHRIRTDHRKTHLLL